MSVFKRYNATERVLQSQSKPQASSLNTLIETGSSSQMTGIGLDNFFLDEDMITCLGYRSMSGSSILRISCMDAVVTMHDYEDNNKQMHFRVETDSQLCIFLEYMLSNIDISLKSSNQLLISGFPFALFHATSSSSRFLSRFLFRLRSIVSSSHHAHVTFFFPLGSILNIHAMLSHFDVVFVIKNLSNPLSSSVFQSISNHVNSKGSQFNSESIGLCHLVKHYDDLRSSTRHERVKMFEPHDIIEKHGMFKLERRHIPPSS
jgi:hypothetical protein